MQQLQGKLPSKYLAYFALNSNKKKPLVITKYLIMKQLLNLLHNLSTYQSLCNLWFFAGNGKEDMRLSTDTNSACVTLHDREND